MSAFVDLRSDTVTRPTAAMRRAIADAEVGDDVLGDDPTVQRLEAMVAERLGKESALFTPSGTMANQIAIRCHTRPGDEILVEGGAHPFNYEAGGAAMISGEVSRPRSSPSSSRAGATAASSWRRPRPRNWPGRTGAVCCPTSSGTSWPYAGSSCGAGGAGATSRWTG